MPLTVAELVAQTPLGLALVAGAAGGRSVIRWAHASELLDPSPWLRGGELVLTTGMALPADDAAHAAYLHRLADADVAGVGFGVGVHHACVPPPLIEAADARGLPLLEVPLPVPFIAITEVIAARQAAEQQETTQRLVEVMRAMTRAALRHGAAGVVRVLTGGLGGSAVVLDEYGGVLTEAGPATRELLADGREELARHDGAGGHGTFSATVSTTAGRLVVQSIGGGSRTRGYLLLRPDAEWSTFAQLALAQANSLLSITVEKPDAVLSAERRLRAEVLSLVLDGARPAEVSGQLAAFGFAGDAAVVAVVLEPAGPGGDGARPASPPAGTGSVAGRAPVAGTGSVAGRAPVAGTGSAAGKGPASGNGPAWEVAEAASRVLERSSAAQLVTVRDGRVVVLLAAGAGDEDALAAEVGRAAQRRVLAGVSSPVPLAGAVDALTQASLAVRAARAEGRPVCRFGQLSTYALLLASQSRQALTLVADSALEPLLEHDRLRGTDLLVTLEVFLAHNAQAVPAAAALGVHRHTLRNRMRKVTELTGRNLDSPHDRTELWLALKAREIARLGGEPADG